MTETMQLFDQLPAHIEAALVGSIERFGVLVPVIKDQHGRILDGHHRARIAHELNIDYPTDTRHVANDEEAAEIARTLNSDRRHLTEDQRREVAAQLRAEGHSLRAIAGALGVAHKTIHRDLASVSGDTDEPEYVMSLDGRRRPARRPPADTTIIDALADDVRQLLKAGTVAPPEWDECLSLYPELEQLDTKQHEQARLTVKALLDMNPDERQRREQTFKRWIAAMIRPTPLAMPEAQGAQLRLARARLAAIATDFDLPKDVIHYVDLAIEAIDNHQEPR